MTIYTFMSDPHHGWLKVPHKDLEALNITPSMITSYSYYDVKHFYLEEDRDLRMFAKVYQAKYGVEPEIKYAKRAKNDSIVRRKKRNEEECTL